MLQTVMKNRRGAATDQYYRLSKGYISGKVSFFSHPCTTAERKQLLLGTWRNTYTQQTAIRENFITTQNVNDSGSEQNSEITL